MKKYFCLVLFICLFSLPLYAKGLRAGLAKVIITPPKPIMMAGYAARTKPSESKYHDIYAKALIIADDNDNGTNRMVLITTDILGYSRELAEMVAETAAQKYGIKREQIMFNASHTHTGPIIRQNLVGAMQVDAEQATIIHEYAQFLHDRIIWVIGQAMKDLSSAKISIGHGTGNFAVNRREKNEAGNVVIGVNKNGVVDQDVPVLLIETQREKLRGIVFGYACHNTTLTAQFYQISGDYAGFAQQEIETKHPGTIAMFVMGCGADVNPNPRSTLELAQQHGSSLASMVDQIIDGKMSSIKGDVKVKFERVMLPFGTLPTKEALEAQLKDANVYKKKQADRMLGRLIRDGKLPSEYPYPIQIFHIGDDFTLIGLGGEVVTDYALRLKKELGTKGLWIAGYSNDVMAYIPSARMFAEGGYEVVDSMIYYDQPTSWKPEIEEIIISKTIEMARKK